MIINCRMNYIMIVEVIIIIGIIYNKLNIKIITINIHIYLIYKNHKQIILVINILKIILIKIVII